MRHFNHAGGAQRALLIGALWLAPVSFLSAQQILSLKLAWEFETPKEFPQGLVCDALNRPYLHVAMKNGGLLILDISDKKAPKLAAKLGAASFADLHVMHLTQRGEYLYLALGDFFNAFGATTGLAVVHVKNPDQPNVTAVWKSTDKLTGSAVVTVGDNYAYLGAMKQGVMIFDVSKPDKIEHVSTFQPEIDFPRKNPTKVQHPNARGLFLQKNRLFVAYDAGGLRILDVTDKKKPREIGRYANKAMAKKQEAFNDVIVANNLAYLPVDYAGFEIVDVTNPRDIRQIGWWNPWSAHELKNLWFNSPGHTNQIAIDSKKKLAYLSAGGSGLQVIDVSNPARPELTAAFGAPKSKLGVWGLSMCSDRVYLLYITAVIPFQGTWAGIKAIER